MGSQKAILPSCPTHPRPVEQLAQVSRPGRCQKPVRSVRSQPVSNTWKSHRSVGWERQSRQVGNLSPSPGTARQGTHRPECIRGNSFGAMLLLMGRIANSPYSSSRMKVRPCSIRCPSNRLWTRKPCRPVWRMAGNASRLRRASS